MEYDDFWFDMILFKSQVVDDCWQEPTGSACLLSPAEDQAMLLHKLSPVTAIPLVEFDCPAAGKAQTSVLSSSPDEIPNLSAKSIPKRLCELIGLAAEKCMKEVKLCGSSGSSSALRSQGSVHFILQWNNKH
ncbi:hypothetical protein EK904_014518 [Melospiza melodia maxima]|nr:hypothetical protein EK904_014518 [Melospiza melodia maxima]